MIVNKFKTFHNVINEELNKKKWEGNRTIVSYVKVALDLFKSIKRYNLSPGEYTLLDFYNTDKERRKKIIPRKERDEFVKAFNKKDDLPKLENKVQFLKNFKQYVNRDFLILNESSIEDFKNFSSSQGGFVAKQSNSGQGEGVKVFGNTQNVEKLYKQLLSYPFDLVEEKVTTHKEIEKLSPGGLPPIRVFTFIDNQNKPHIIFTGMNLSTGNSVVNFSNDGIKVIINPDNGEIVTHPINKNNEKLDKHPVTNASIKGFFIPGWDKLKSMILSAAMEVPTVRYVGWDCAISDKGPMIIEANAERPGINGQQMPGYDKADEVYANFDFVRSEFQKIKE